MSTPFDEIDKISAQKSPGIVFRVMQHGSSVTQSISTAISDLETARDAETPDWADVTDVCTNLTALIADIATEMAKLKAKSAR